MSRLGTAYDNWAGDRIVKLNKGGLKFCAVYLCYFVLMAAIALLAGGSKGGFFFASLAVAPLGLLVGLPALVGLGEATMHFFQRYDFLNTAFFTVPASFVIVYLTGCALSAFARAAKGVESDPSLLVVDPPGWSDKR